MELEGPALPADYLAPEPLLDELSVHLGTILLSNGDRMPVLQHPLLYSVPYAPEMNRMLNANFQDKQRRIEKSLEESNDVAYVLAHERPYRADALLALVDLGLFHGVSDGAIRYWKAVGAWWIDTENALEVLDRWERLWTGPEQFRHAKRFAMTKREQDELAALPDPIEVFHGEEEPDRIGWSWMTDLRVARWFANRFTGGRRVYTGLAPKDAVIAYLSRRGESEVLIRPEDVLTRRIAVS